VYNKSMVTKAIYKLTHCDSGLKLNFLMHLFLLITLVFSVGMLIGDPTVSVTVLYLETVAISQGALNIWGVVGILSIVFHVAGLLIRGHIGGILMSCAVLCGFYIWLWAGVIYLVAGFTFQFLAVAVPNLLFWSWYAWQWRRRHQNKRVAFV
jgi:hypothetical protein